MKKRKIFLLMLVTALLFTACTSKDHEKDASNKKEDFILVTDMLGREVEVPANAEKFVNIGVGCLRLYTYAGPLDKLVGVENVEHGDTTDMPFSKVNSDIFLNLPLIGEGGPAGDADTEQLLNVGPDVIFTTYATEKAQVDGLQEKTGIPVIALSYGDLGDIFSEEIYTSIGLVGKVTGNEEKAKKAIDTLEAYKQDLIDRTKGISDEGKPTVYVGGLGNKGARGIESTRGNHVIFNVLHAKNVVDQAGKDGSLIIDKEILLEWDPDYIFLDLTGLHLVQEDYGVNPNFYESLQAVANDNLYAQLPYNKQTVNIDTAIADAYYIGTVLYPEQFSDIDIAVKTDEIYTNLLGKPFYEQMIEDGREFGKIKLGQ